MKIIVIGGGPAGMMSAITAKQNGSEVVLLEKMTSLGRKLLITGKGRCNITSSLGMEEFIKNTPRNGKFLYSCYQNYTNQDIIYFLKEQGLEVKEERGNRIFPVTDKSQDVLKCFTKKLKELKVEIRYETEVKQIQIDGENKQVVGVQTNQGEIKADKIILATGGKSYPLTGSTGDGYRLAKNLGHTIVEARPSLVPFETYNREICKKLQGLSLRNVEMKIVDKEAKKEIYKGFGEMLFTHFGVSGPIVLSGSSYLVGYKKAEEKLKNQKIEIRIDLKPALSEEKLDERIRRDFQENSNKQFKNSLDKLLPQKLIPVIIKESGINEKKVINEITKEERRRLVRFVKKFYNCSKMF